MKIITYLMFVLGCSLAVAEDAIVAPDAPKVIYPYRFSQTRNPFQHGPTYFFETRNTSVRWRAIALAKTPLPVLEVSSQSTQVLYNWSQSRGFTRSMAAITPLHRKDYYHNGIFMKSPTGQMFYQMIYIGPGGKESLAGWVSGADLVSPMTPSMLDKPESKTAAGISNCAYFGTCVDSPAKSLNQLSNEITPLLLSQMFRPPMGEAKKSVCPFSAPLKVVKTSQFGHRKDPFTGRTKYHSGCDLVGQGQSPAPIKSIMGGRVTKVSGGPSVGGQLYGWASAGGYGYQVEVTNDDGTVVTYNHLDRSCVKVAMEQRVEAGTQIGCMGSTGRSTGPHLHLEVKRNGVKIDPESWVNIDAVCAGRISKR